MNLSKGFSMFYGSRALENKIAEFLDRISEAGLMYKKAIHVFLEHGVTEDFVTHAEQIGHIESRADELRREYVNSCGPLRKSDVTKCWDEWIRSPWPWQ